MEENTGENSESDPVIIQEGIEITFAGAAPGQVVLVDKEGGGNRKAQKIPLGKPKVTSCKQHGQLEYQLQMDNVTEHLKQHQMYP